jgi:Uma2 family endonuclease
MVRALPDDGKRYEVIDGELLVTPSPGHWHQHAVTQLILLLGPYVQASGIGTLLPSPSDIELDPHGLVQPDVFVMGHVEGRQDGGWNSGAPYLLFIEILSPSTARHDRFTKRRRFQRAGIPEYWIVDLDARCIERWRPTDERLEIISETLTWQPVAEHPPLAIDLPAMFARIFGETR